MLKRAKKIARDEGGQSMIEFIMLIPLIMAFVWYLVHVNMAINKSIVGQKHARSQLFLKLYNHRSGPVANEFGRSERSHFYVGVSASPTGASNTAVAPIESLGIGMNPTPNTAANDDPGDAEPGSLRQRVRVRTAFGICTHRKRLKDGSGLTDFCGSTPE